MLSLNKISILIQEGKLRSSRRTASYLGVPKLTTDILEYLRIFINAHRMLCKIYLILQIPANFLKNPFSLLFIRKERKDIYNKNTFSYYIFISMPPNSMSDLSPEDIFSAFWVEVNTKIKIVHLKWSLNKI